MTQSAAQRCNAYRRKIIELSKSVAALHVAPAFSCIEIVDAIYNTYLFKGNLRADEDSIFIMSKGHGCLIQYIILNEKGLIPSEDLAKYCKPDGYLGAHPDYGVPGIEASTGSLGHGAGLAVGRAIGKKLQGKPGNVYCLLSDGELQEGSSWEAIMMASNKNLDNLIFLVDNNDFSGLERMSEAHQAFYPLSEKFAAFGCDVQEIDGHASEAVNAALQKASAKPKAIICKTVKGKGVSYMEHEPIWHYRAPNEEEYDIAMKELA